MFADGCEAEMHENRCSEQEETGLWINRITRQQQLTYKINRKQQMCLCLKVHQINLPCVNHGRLLCSQMS